MVLRLFASLLLVAVVPACPRAPKIANVTPGVLPRSLEGFELGASESAVRAKLKRGKYTIETLNAPSARVSSIRARPPAEHPRLLYVRFSFADRVLFSVRVGFKPAAEVTGKALVQACEPDRVIGGGGFYVQCVDRAEKLALSAQRSGERVSIVDIDRAVAAGVLTRERLRKLLAQPPKSGFVRMVLGGKKATGPLQRVHEGVQLGDTRSNVLLPFQPPLWSLRTTTRERRGTRYRQVHLRAVSHAQLEEVALDFDEEKQRLVRARFQYKSGSPARAQELQARCQGHVHVPGRVNRSACRHEWETLLSFRQDGRAVLLVDLGAALSNGLVTKAEIDPSAPEEKPVQ